MGRGSSGLGKKLGGGGKAVSNAAALNAEVDKIYSAAGGQNWRIDTSAIAALVGKMKKGESVTVKNYNNGALMEFRKNKDVDTGSVSDYTNVLSSNSYASRQQVESWVRDSVTYAHYKPVFK